MILPVIINLFGWGTACQWCEGDAFDCEECLGILTPRCPKRTEASA